MKKFLFSVCAVLAILGCGGDNVDELPCFSCNEQGYGGSPYIPSSSSPYVPGSSSPNWYGSSSSSSLAHSGKGNNIGSYRTVVIGTQKWMAENLDYVVEGSKCHGNNSANCDTYGSLYNWATAMNLPSGCNSNSCSGQINSPHRGICPSGWHIPSNDDWDKLMDAVGGSNTAGTKLKATSGWDDCGRSGSGKSYLCEDAYGFSALPGGVGGLDGYFYNVDNFGLWWSASEYHSNVAYNRSMYYSSEGASWDDNDKDTLSSVRCVEDE